MLKAPAGMWGYFPAVCREADNVLISIGVEIYLLILTPKNYVWVVLRVFLVFYIKV